MVAVVQVTVRGELDWHGYLLRCSECGSAAGWQMRTYENVLDDGHVAGEFATAACTGCQSDTEHPLIYPGMVRALAAAAPDGGIASADAARVLNGIRWRPHGTHWQYPDDAPSMDEYLLHGVAVFLPWEEPERQWPYPGDPWWVWHQHWPELLAAVDGLPVPQPPWRSQPGTNRDRHILGSASCTYETQRRPAQARNPGCDHGGLQRCPPGSRL